jgi:aminoglycoside phosphotransferase (APT) family kinase protein
MNVAARMSDEQRRRLSLSMIGALAAVHAVDIEQAGLADLASHKPYAPRQLKRWGSQ